MALILVKDTALVMNRTSTQMTRRPATVSSLDDQIHNGHSHHVLLLCETWKSDSHNSWIEFILRYLIIPNCTQIAAQYALDCSLYHTGNKILAPSQPHRPFSACVCGPVHI